MAYNCRSLLLGEYRSSTLGSKVELIYLILQRIATFRFHQLQNVHLVLTQTWCTTGSKDCIKHASLTKASISVLNTVSNLEFWRIQLVKLLMECTRWRQTQKILQTLAINFRSISSLVINFHNALKVSVPADWCTTDVWKCRNFAGKPVRVVNLTTNETIEGDLDIYTYLNTIG